MMWGSNRVHADRRQYKYEDFVSICDEIKDYCEKNKSGNKNENKEGKKEYNVVEGIRAIAEMLIWEDQNCENMCFEYICEHDIIETLVYMIIEREMDYKIRRQSLQTVSILLQNISNIQTLYYILSKNVISVLLDNTFNSYEIRTIKASDSLEFESNLNAINKNQEEYDELVSYYIVLLRTLALRLNNDTIRLFYNENNFEFPLWVNACYFINFSDQMVKNTSRNVILNILGNNNELINTYVVYEEIKQYNTKQREEIIGKLDKEDALFSAKLENMLMRKSIYERKKESTVADYQLNIDEKEEICCNECQNNEYKGDNHDFDNNSGLIQIITSLLVRQIYELAEFVEMSNFEWPDVEEYMYKLSWVNEESGYSYEDDIFGCKNTSHSGIPSSSSSKYYVTPIKATSPITFSYSETNSPGSYNSPVVDQLSTSFHDGIVRPLKKLIEEIYDTLELINEIISLEIGVINVLMFDSILKYIFEMVIFQNILIIVKEANHGLDINSESKSKNNKDGLSLKLYLYLTYKIILYFQDNNYNLKYSQIIDEIWEMFFGLSNRNQGFFGDTFSTLISCAAQDSEFLLIFGLIGLHSDHYFNSESESESGDTRLGFLLNKSVEFQQENQKLERCSAIKEENEATENKNVENDNLQKYFPNFLHSIVQNFKNYFQYKKYGHDEIIKEMIMENSGEKICKVEIEFNTTLNKMKSCKYKNNSGSFNANSTLRRSNSAPVKLVISESNHDLCNNSHYFDSVITLFKNYKNINFDFEMSINDLDFELKKQLETFYSRINCESKHIKKYEYGYMLYIIQFLERTVYKSGLNNHETNMRPFCLLLISYLISDITEKSKRYLCNITDENNCNTENNNRGKESIHNSDNLVFISVFERSLELFFKYYRILTLKNINQILKRDLIGDFEYCFYEKMGNINYILCENLFEWKEEDGLLISKLFKAQRSKVIQWIHEAISDHCGLITNKVNSRQIDSNEIHKNKGRGSARKYIWNLIDTYPFLRWFPNTSNTHFFTENTKSVYIDKLRSVYNNYQIFETLRKTVKYINKGEEDCCNTSDLSNAELLLRETNMSASRIKVAFESKFYKAKILRTYSHTNYNSYKINCVMIFDNENSRLLFTTINNDVEKRINVALICKFNYKECKPVPIVTRSFKKSVRYIVGLLVRCKKEDLKKCVYLKGIIYELPHRDELLNSPNVSKGAVIQTKESNNREKKTTYHLNNLLLPVYTRFSIDKDKMFASNELNYNDYAMYLEFENKKKSQDFIKRLNNIRREIVVNDTYNTYSDIYKNTFTGNITA